MIQPGQHVKCFLNNSMVMEGIVVNWGKQVELQTLDGKSLLIIHHPERDIVMSKVLLTPENNINSPEPATSTLPDDTSSPEVQIDPMALRAKSMAELKIDLANQEKEIVAQQLKDHRPGPRLNKVIYNFPQSFNRKKI